MDRVSARDALYAFGRDRYLEGCALATVDGTLRYGGVVDKSLPGDDTYWARVTTQVVAETQETLRNEVRRFVTNGQVFVQLFSPKADSRALGHTDVIAEYVRNAFRTYQGDDLEFTNAEINDNVPQSNQAWWQVNIVVNFAYRQFL